jgi:hypothetical protein
MSGLPQTRRLLVAAVRAPALAAPERAITPISASRRAVAFEKMRVR